MQGILRDTEREFRFIYGSPHYMWVEAKEIMDDLHKGCRLCKTGASPVELDTVRVQDGKALKTQIGPRGKRQEISISPRELALEVGRLSGFEQVLENIGDDYV